MSEATIPGTEQAWDDGTLGDDEEFVGVAPKALQDAITQSLGMQAISIRLPKDLVEQYKTIARINGVGYQPLMRDALVRFATYEMKRLLIEFAEQKEKAEQRSREESIAHEPRQAA